MSIKSAERFLRHSRTRQLSAMLERYIDPHGDPRTYWAKEVTFDYSTNHKIRVDYMRFKPLNNTTSGIEKGDFYAYEIKSSVEDFKSLNGHNFIADYNYYVMPTDIYEAVKDAVPYGVGVLCPDGEQLRSVRCCSCCGAAHVGKSLQGEKIATNKNTIRNTTKPEFPPEEWRKAVIIRDVI